MDIVSFFVIAPKETTQMSLSGEVGKLWGTGTMDTTQQ